MCHFHAVGDADQMNLIDLVGQFLDIVGIFLQCDNFPNIPGFVSRNIIEQWDYPPTEMTPEKDTSEKASIKVLRLFFVFPLDMVTIDPFPFSPRMSGQGDIEFTFGPTTPGGPPGTLCTILRSPHERSRRSHRDS